MLIIFVLGIILINTGIFIGILNKIKLNRNQKIPKLREEKEKLQNIKIKSIRVISTAQPLMINGMEIEKRAYSELPHKVIYID